MDLELTVRDLQSLADADSFVALFTRLGYATRARSPQTTSSLGISAESLVRQILRAERLADHEGLLQVYLFEVKSVTVALTRGLARVFRNLNIQFPLLILATPDYERVDFVLLERSAPEATNVRRLVPTTPQVGVRPRVLSIERRKPTPLQRRILQRFTWTEPDPFAQFDKLAAAYVLVEWSEQYFNNRALFSDHCLLDRLQGMPEWQEDPKPVYRRLRERYLDAAARLASKSEEELRQELFEPTLSALGFEFQRGKAASSDAVEPDYLLFSPGAANRVIAVCLTYRWDRLLDGKDSQRGDDTPEENPGAIVVTLLEQGRAPWVIVSNGRLWRLYSRHTHARATNYYEIDLEEALSRTAPETENPAEAFRYYWLLFREQAFAPRETVQHGETKEASFLDRVLQESEEYARELGERLKERVFTEVFPHLAEGFLLSLRTTEDSDESARLEEIFRATLTLLYRLLFLLYAESRGLLPVRETRDYFLSSLQRLKGEIADAAGTIRDQVPERLGRRYRKDSADLYDRLRQLFRYIDQGERELNLPAYNGGLFATSPPEEDTTAEADAARFLEAHAVPDFHLSLALDLLARDEDPKRHDLVAVDYKSLGVRQLGSIYEGLLEFKLRIAEQPLAVVKEKGREVYVPLADLDERKRERAARGGRVKKRGQLYLENDKHERKATGSYYTPDYIVQYIVEQTLGPLLRDRFDSLRPKLREAQAWHRRKLEEAHAKGEPSDKYEDGLTVIDRWRSDILDSFFEVKVLDPAMGSGHFLVEAVDFITDKMLDFLNGFPWNPVQAYLAQTRREILQSAEQQEIILAPERLTDVNLLKRHVLKRCLYGVVLNPMAVELAKVSLWLHCFTLGAPLSFLDHHLRCGNSLIGVTVAEVRELLEGREGEQITIFGSRFAQLLLATDLSAAWASFLMSRPPKSSSRVANMATPQTP
ncbi:MAG TPA: hypothetical protein VNJ70_05095 [Thermoanaerobaculia bacterium]|nr:hypothetical protein [Thermoanaerobaculia bacterium]